MTTHIHIARRRVLRFLVLLSAFGLTRPGYVLAKTGTSRIRDPLAAKLTACFSRQGSAAVVGGEYLRRVPLEADEHVLVHLICSSRGDRGIEFAKADKRKLRELLQLQQRQDFEAGRIVNVKGWLLSETEARLCALAALN